MSEWIWFNGKIMPFQKACINVEDRGFQFADGVYEVFRVYNGRLFAAAEHLQRLEKSAEGIRLQLPLEKAQLREQIELLLKKNAMKNAMVYLQLSRGSSPRNHAFPTCQPTLLFYARPLPAPAPAGQGGPVKVLPVPDDRWDRCWIKSIALLPNILAKNQAIDSGYDEAVFIQYGVVTECSASNIFAVIDDTLITHPVGTKVLPGITRDLLVEVARYMGVRIEKRAWTESEAASAQEIFITSTTREVNWVSHWGEKKISSRCGPLTRRLHEGLLDKIQRATQQ